MRDALAIRLRDAPFGDGRQLRIALRVVDEIDLSVVDAVGQDVAQRGRAFGDIDAVLAERRIEIDEALFDALEQQDRREHPARVADQVRRRRGRALAGLEVLEAVALFPENDTVAHDGRRHTGDAGLLAQRFEIGVEDRDDAVGREDRLLRRADGRRQEQSARESGQQPAHGQRISVNFMNPTTSSPCQGHTKAALRGAAWARTRT